MNIQVKKDENKICLNIMNYIYCESYNKCHICRNNLIEKCSNCESDKTDCFIAFGKCGDYYHQHCIDNRLKHVSFCPFDNQKWNQYSNESITILFELLESNNFKLSDTIKCQQKKFLNKNRIKQIFIDKKFDIKYTKDNHKQWPSIIQYHVFQLILISKYRNTSKFNIIRGSLAKGIVLLIIEYYIINFIKQF